MSVDPRRFGPKSIAHLRAMLRAAEINEQTHLPTDFANAPDPNHQRVELSVEHALPAIPNVLCSSLNNILWPPSSRQHRSGSPHVTTKFWNAMQLSSPLRDRARRGSLWRSLPCTAYMVHGYVETCVRLSSRSKLADAESALGYARVASDHPPLPRVCDPCSLVPITPRGRSPRRGSSSSPRASPRSAVRWRSPPTGPTARGGSTAWHVRLRGRTVAGQKCNGGRGGLCGISWEHGRSKLGRVSPGPGVA